MRRNRMTGRMGDEEKVDAWMRKVSEIGMDSTR